MSKLRKDQRQKRWATTTGLVVPEAYLEEVTALAAELDQGSGLASHSPDLRSFAALLLHLLQQRDSYAEVQAVKPLCAAVVQLGLHVAPQQPQQQFEQQHADLQRMQTLLVQLLLLPNSRALHKQLLSSLRPLLDAQQQAQQQQAQQQVQLQQQAQHQVQQHEASAPAAGTGCVPGSQPFAATAAAHLSRAAEAQLKSGSGTAGADALRLGSALAALLANAACKPALLRCAVSAVAALAAGIRAALEPLGLSSAAADSEDPAAVTAAAGANGGAGKAGEATGAAVAVAASMPIDVMEGLQDSVSALHHLLTGFGAAMLEEQPDAAAAAVAAAGETLLHALQGQRLAREALASAGVALYAAAALPAAVPAQVARCFAEGLLLQHDPLEQPAERTNGSSGYSGQLLAVRLQVPGESPCAAAAAGSCAARGTEVRAPIGILDAHLQRCAQQLPGAGLAAELRRLPPLSRLCAIRGLLSATPANVLCAPLLAWPCQATAEGATSHGQVAPGSRWLLLVDGALPAIAAAVQGTTDEHFRFHAYLTLFVCLDRLKTFLRQGVAAATARMQLECCFGEQEPQAQQQQGQQDLTQQDPQREQQREQQQWGQGCVAEEGCGAVPVPLLDAAWQRLIMQLLWQGFEAPLSQTLHRVAASFEALLDILQLQQQLGAASGEPAAGADNREALLGIAGNLLGVDASRKGRYAPLEAIVPRVGASALLKLQPGLIATCLGVMGEHLVSASVASMLLALLAQLQLEAERCQLIGKECSSACGAGEGSSNGVGGWRDCWLPLLAAALRNGSEVQRDNLAAHLLPRLLAMDPSALGLLLQQLLPRGGSGVGGGGGSDSTAAACMAVLKAARRQQLLGDLASVAVPGFDGTAIRAALLSAVRSRNDGLRLDALSLVCCHPRITQAPSSLELEVAAEAVRLSLRCSHSSIKHRVLAAVARLLARQRGAVAAIIARKPALADSSNTAAAAADDAALAAQQRWLHWLGGVLTSSLYPGAPHPRSVMALELLSLQLDAFGDLINPSLPPPSWCKQLAALRPGQFEAFGPSFCTPGTAQLLLAASLDSWERLREAASIVLLRMPTPLPGFGSASELQPLLRRALCLLACPRSREADAGAQLLLLLLRKYGGAGAGGDGGGLCWHINLAACSVEAPEEHASPLPSPPRQRQAAALWCFLSSACDLLQQRAKLAAADLLAACCGGLAQGVLLALRHAVPHLPWQRLVEAQQRQQQLGHDWRGLTARLLALIYTVSELTLPVLSKAQNQNTDAADVDAADLALEDEEEESAALDPADLASSGGGGTLLGPAAQVINTGCWQSCKESVLLLGGLARALPLYGPATLLSGEQLSAMAAHFIRLLCELKHSGAIDKAQQGFAALCEVLFQHHDPALRQLPQRCMRQLLAYLRRPGQGPRDIVRRSGGLPFGVVAIFASEPSSSSKVLLHHGMEELLATAGDEGPGAADSWPRVHALNCLRAAFQDADLAIDMSAHLAAGLQVAILGMAAAGWQVRNAASLCYTALLIRVLGFRNRGTKGAAVTKRAPTAADFFARHPTLHPFLLSQLAAAVTALDGHTSGAAAAAANCTGASDAASFCLTPAAAAAGEDPSSSSSLSSGGGSQSSSGSTGDLHPSMFPVLVLLSRLRCSQHNRVSGGAGSSGLAEQWLSPAAFAPLLQRCSACPTMAVRSLAAKALPPLLTPEQQPAVAATLAAEVAEAVAAAAAAVGRDVPGASTGGPAATAAPEVPPPAVSVTLHERPQQRQVSFNALHGRLLQLRALLEAAAETGDAAAAGALLAGIVGPLAACAVKACWLGTATSSNRGEGARRQRSCLPAASSLEYIRAAAAAAALLPAGPAASAAAEHATAGKDLGTAAIPAGVSAWLQAVQQHCWQAVQSSAESSTPPADFSSPMLSFANKHAAQLSFTLLLSCERQEQVAPLPPGQGANGHAASSLAGSGGGGGGGSQLAAVQQLASALCLPLYEVRAAALKVLLRHVQAQQAQQAQRGDGQALQQASQQGSAQRLPAAALRALLHQQLKHEQHHKVQRRLLHLLASLPAGDEGSSGDAATADAAAVADEFAAMLCWARSRADARIRQHAIQCLGPLLAQLVRRQQPGCLLDGSPAAAAAEQLLALLAECSQPQQMQELRLAAAAALAASGLLAAHPRHSAAAAGAVTAAWALALRLAEDEDEAVREVAAVAAAAVLAEWSKPQVPRPDSPGSIDTSLLQSAVPGLATAAAKEAPLAAPKVLVDVEPESPSEERLLRRAFPALAARFGPHPALLGLLCRLCCPDAAAAGGAGTTAEASATAPPMVVGAAKGDRLFDREVDNTHEDPLLMAQLAAGCMAQLLPLITAKSPAVVHVQTWGAAAVRRLEQLAACLESRAAVDAAGAGSSAVQAAHHEHFQQLYTAWLAVWVAAHVPERGESAGWECDMAAAVAALVDSAAGPAAAGSTTPQLQAAADAAAAAWAWRHDSRQTPTSSGEQVLFLV